MGQKDTRGSARLAGHSLAYEGSPYDEHGNRIWRSCGGTYGLGRGKCSCGELSEPLPSATARKAWHRVHKAEVRAATSHAAQGEA